MLQKLLITTPILFNGIFLALVCWNNWRLENGTVKSIRETAPYEFLMFCIVFLIGSLGFIFAIYSYSRGRKKVALAMFGSLILGLILFVIAFAFEPSIIYVT